MSPHVGLKFACGEPRSSRLRAARGESTREKEYRRSRRAPSVRTHRGEAGGRPAPALVAATSARMAARGKALAHDLPRRALIDEIELQLARRALAALTACGDDGGGSDEGQGGAASAASTSTSASATNASGSVGSSGEASTSAGPGATTGGEGGAPGATSGGGEGGEAPTSTASSAGGDGGAPGVTVGRRRRWRGAHEHGFVWRRRLPRALRERVRVQRRDLRSTCGLLRWKRRLSQRARRRTGSLHGLGRRSHRVRHRDSPGRGPRVAARSRRAHRRRW